MIATFVVLQGPILNPVDPLAEAAGTTVQLRFDDPEGDVMGTISADGHYLSCSHWETGNAGICDLVSGEKKVLTQYGDWSEPRRRDLAHDAGRTHGGRDPRLDPAT